MPSLASISDPKVYHILSYGTLLGSTFYQSFLAGPLAYSCLPRPQFATLQTKITPPFFWLQSLLPLAMVVTWPGEKLAGAAGVGLVRQSPGWRGLLEESNIWAVTVPIGIMLGTALLNLAALGPATTKIMRDRKRQGGSPGNQRGG
jgi:hypothetical protein